MRKYKEYSNEDIINYAKEVNSIASLLKKLNLKETYNFGSVSILKYIDCPFERGSSL